VTSSIDLPSTDEGSRWAAARLHGDAGLHVRALEIAHEHQLLAAYDAHCVAPAERLRVPLWTCDRRLVKELGEGAPEVHLVL
jgi:predicted nucleic acid-binding protein